MGYRGNEVTSLIDPENRLSLLHTEGKESRPLFLGFIVGFETLGTCDPSECDGGTLFRTSFFWPPIDLRNLRRVTRGVGSLVLEEDRRLVS